MKNIFIIFVLLIFTNFTVSPLFFSSSYFGKVTEERAETGEEESNSLEEERDIKQFQQTDVAFKLTLHSETNHSIFYTPRLQSIYIDCLIKPPCRIG